MNERPKGKYPSLDWWDAQPDSGWLDEHARRLIRIGYYEALYDIGEKQRRLTEAVASGQIATSGTATRIVIPLTPTP